MNDEHGGTDVKSTHNDPEPCGRSQTKTPGTLAAVVSLVGLSVGIATVSTAAGAARRTVGRPAAPPSVTPSITRKIDKSSPATPTVQQAPSATSLKQTPSAMQFKKPAPSSGQQKYDIATSSPK